VTSRSSDSDIPATLRYLPNTAVKMGSAKRWVGHKNVIKWGNIAERCAHRTQSRCSKDRAALTRHRCQSYNEKWLPGFYDILARFGLAPCPPNQGIQISWPRLMASTYAHRTLDYQLNSKLTLSSPSLILVECILLGYNFFPIFLLHNIMCVKWGVQKSFALSECFCVCGRTW